MMMIMIISGNNNAVRPHREWADNIVDWCRASLQELSYSAQDKTKWNEIIKEASDSSGHWAQWFMTTMMMMSDKLPNVTLQ